MSGVNRGQADRRRDRLESYSPMRRSQTSSSHPPHRDEPPNLAPGVSQQAFETSWPDVAMQVTTPLHSPSPELSIPAPNMSLAPSAVLSRPIGQMAIINNNSNINHNAAGGTIINNNSVTQVASRDQTAEDLNTIEKGLGQLHVSRAVYDAQPLTAGCIDGTRVQLLKNTQNLLAFRGGAHIVWIAGMAGTGKTSIALTLCRRLAEEPTVLLGGTFFCSRSAGMMDRTDSQRIIPTLATLLARQVPAYARALAIELTKDPDLASKAATVQVKHLLSRPLQRVRTLDKQIVFAVDALDECRDQVSLAELIDALADFETTPLNNPDNHERLLRLIDAVTDFKVTQLDDRTRLAELIEALVDFKTTPLDVNENQAKLKVLIDALVDFQKTWIDGRARLRKHIDALTEFVEMHLIDFRSHTKLAEITDALSDFKMTQPNYFRNRTRLVELIDALVRFETTPGNDDDQTRLFQLIKAISDFKATPLDDQARLVELIEALTDLKAMPLDNLGNRARLTRLIDGLADFRATRLYDQVGLPELIDALSDFKTRPLDKYENQVRLEGLIDALVDFETTPLKNSNDHVQLTKFIDALADFRTTPRIKFLLTSRPEMHIRDTLITDTSLSSIVQLHMVDERLVTSDIRLYIQKTLESSSRSLKWYTDTDVDDLAALSAGLFIFASTVLAYILRRKDGPGRLDRLRTVKQQTSASAIAADPLDRMYLLVLMQAADPHAYEPTELDETRRIVAVILSTRSPLTIRALADLLGLSSEHLRGALDELHAIVLVPEQDDTGELRTLHASFGDFIFTRAPAHIRIDKSFGHDELARACLERMNADDLCFNVSCSRSSYEPNGDVQPVWTPRSLIYACQNWVHHIALASERSSFDDSIYRVLRLKFLFWLEMFSVMGEVGAAINLLELAVEEVTSPDVLQFLRDAKSFVASSRNAIERSAPHIYLSALAFAPKDSAVYQTFYPYFTGLPEIETLGINGSLYDRTICAPNDAGDSLHDLPVNGHKGPVNAVAVCRDGHFIASASVDGSARVWDSQTCQQMYPPLLRHDGPVRSVAISLDGRWIATGSEDTSVLLWNAQTGQFAMAEFCGHTRSITAIAFSPNCLHLASGSSDGAVQVWDIATRRLEKTLRINSVEGVSSVAYSPSGAVISVGSTDGWVYIFDAITGQELRIFRSSDFYGPRSLAFSPDGARLVTALGIDVDVFDIETGQRVTKLLDLPPESFVNAVAYSPDGQFIVCGTRDHRIIIWHLDVGHVLKWFWLGHTSAINSVTFSSDGRFLVTGSEDTTIRISELEKIRSFSDGSDQSPITALAFAQYEKRSYGPFNCWVVSPSGQLLLWVPPEYRGHLEIGSHSRIFATHRVTITAENGVLHQGEDWIRCWRSQNVSAS